MTLDVRCNGLSLADLIAGPPRISDQLEAICSTLELPVKDADGLATYLGQPVELWYNGERWFYGELRKRNVDDTGQWTYTAVDLLYFLKKNPDDYYIKNMTATQGIKYLAAESAVPVGSLANTKAVFPMLYYQGAEPDKVALDLIARTYQATGKKYWLRFDPSAAGFGLTLFERVVPALIWAFQVGVNLTRASLEESIEEAVTVVKLVNRETGKTVVKANAQKMKEWGVTKHFEEVDKDKAKTMEKDAAKLLDDLCKITTTISLEGVNPNRVMPRLYSGDVIYAEEKHTKLLGAYHIKDITHTFISDQLVEIGAEVQRAPDIPAVQYEDATKRPEIMGSGKGAQENPKRDAATNALIDKYGL